MKHTMILPLFLLLLSTAYVAFAESGPMQRTGEEESAQKEQLTDAKVYSGVGVVKEVDTKLNGATTCLCIDEVRPAG